MPSDTYTRSLHDALPISVAAPWLQKDAAPPRYYFEVTKLFTSPTPEVLTRSVGIAPVDALVTTIRVFTRARRFLGWRHLIFYRSEEHTSELQSLRHLVCRPTPTLVPYTTLFRSLSLLRGSRRTRLRRDITLKLQNCSPLPPQKS